MKIAQYVINVTMGVENKLDSQTFRSYKLIKFGFLSWFVAPGIDDHRFLGFVKCYVGVFRKWIENKRLDSHPAKLRKLAWLVLD
jgi:hypothetical protein